MQSFRHAPSGAVIVVISQWHITFNRTPLARLPPWQ
jgi:hypothetical protein